MSCGYLLQVVKEHMPNEAATVFEKCVHEKALALSGKVRTVKHYQVLSTARY